MARICLVMALVLAGCGAGSSKEDAASDAGPVSVDPPPDAGPTGLVPQTPPGVDRLTTGERGATLALDGQRLYWASQVYAANAGDDQILLRSMPRAGGAATTLATLPGVISGATVGGSTGGVELLSADQDALYLSAVNCSRDPANSYGCSPAVSQEASAVLYRVAKVDGAVTTVDPASRSLASAPPQISGTRSYLTQDPQPLLGKPGCLQVTNLGGSHCIDRGMYHYGPLLLDGAGVFYLRDGDVFRAGLDAPADPVDTDGEWTESGAAVPAPQAVTPSAAATVLAPAGLLNSMAIDEDNVYWTAGSDSLYAGSLQAVPKAGGAPVTLAALRGSGYDLDASTGSLIFSHYTDDGLSFSGIRRLSKQGGALEWLGRPIRTLVDGDSLVYQDTDGSLYRADLDGGNRVSLGVNQPQMTWGGFTVSNGEIFWLDYGGGGPNARIAATANGVTRTILPLDGYRYSTFKLAADAENVYVLTDGGLSRVPRAGGPPTLLDTRAIDVEAHGGRVYWTQLPYGPTLAPLQACLNAADPDGKNQVCLYSSSGYLSDVHADGRSVFFMAWFASGGTILRVDLP